MEVLDYLVKPIPFPRFLKAVNKALRNKSTSASGTGMIETDHLFVKIDKKKMKNQSAGYSGSGKSQRLYQDYYLHQ